MRLHVLAAGAGLAAFAAGAAAGVAFAAEPTRGPGADDYARAERFLPWNQDRYVVNGDIQHHWIGSEDRFWYARTNTSGGIEFVVVDAKSGVTRPAFDQKKVAAAIARQTHNETQPGKLPFLSFSFVQGDKAIRFELPGSLWTCTVKTGTCGSQPQPAPKANESVSPDGKRAVYVHDHNLWARDLAGGAGVALTTDGTEHFSYATAPGFSTHAVADQRNPDSVAPEVIWSPDSRYVIAHRVDEREVKDYYLVQSVPDDGGIRPRLYTYRYALPGDEHLPQLQAFVFDLKERRRVAISGDLQGSTAENLLRQHAEWWSADSSKIYFIKRDRFSKSVSLHVAEPLSGTARQILREDSDTSVRVSNDDNPFADVPAIRTLSNGDVIWYSERDGWGHLYYYESANGALRNQITRGAWSVRTLVRVDEARNLVYFTAGGREPGNPYEQYLYAIRTDGTGIRLLTPESGNHSLNRIQSLSAADTPLSADAETRPFSASGRYFVGSYSRPDEPPVLALRSADGRMIRRLETADITELRAGGYSPILPFEVLATDGKTKLYGNLMRPSGFDPDKCYPVIDAVYPGPQQTRSRTGFLEANFDAFESQSLAELGFIVVTVDGRGTPHRSREFLDYSYGRMDKASDLDDHISAIRQLGARYRYMDLNRVGIDGASGGGYAAAHAVLAHPEFYKAAVAASGNHDQRAYLAPWGDTYTGVLSGDSYASSLNAPLAGNLQGKLLLAHGEMDDNVTPAITLKLVDALIKANADFDLLIIPNGDHGIDLSPYFIRRKWDFFVRNLLGARPPPHYLITPPEQ